MSPVAAFFGFAGVAALSWEGAKILFFVFLILFNALFHLVLLAYLIVAIPTLFVVVTVAFFMMRAAPSLLTIWG